MSRTSTMAGVTLLFLIHGATLAADQLDRTVLPIQAPPRFDVTAPEGAPNVVIVLIDDVGFGGPSTFGGPIQTPTVTALAENGLRFNNFHTPRCFHRCATR